MEQPLIIRPPCSCLIDQDRRIGNDPVGHACHKPAEETFWEGGLCWDVCVDCARMLREGSDRVRLRIGRARVGEG